MRRLIIQLAGFLGEVAIVVAVLIAWMLGRQVSDTAALLFAGGAFLCAVILTGAFFCLIETAENSAKMLKALQSLSQQMPIANDGPQTTMPIANGPQTAEYRGYTYRVDSNGGAQVKLTSGQWRNFPSEEGVKTYIDALRGGSSRHTKS
jgi:hypothetical protein